MNIFRWAGRMRRIGRLGYWRSQFLMQIGWRNLFWRFYWFSPKEERRCLELYARALGIEPIAEETNAALRVRLAASWENPDVVLRESKRP